MNSSKILLARAGWAAASIVILLAAGVAMAQTDPCAGATGKGERIKCKTEKVHQRLSDLVDRVTGDDDGLLTPHQKDQLRHARDRAGAEVTRTPSGDFKKFSRKRDGSCYTKEYDDTDTSTPRDPLDDGNNDGICDKNELCAEAIDGIGDDDGYCEKLTGHGKPVWEPCVEICEANDADEDNYDDAVVDEMETQLDDLSYAVGEADTAVTARLAARAARESAAPRAASGVTGCSDLLDRSRDFDYESLRNLLIAADSATTVAETTRAGCQQEFFGWNCRAVALVFGLAGNVLGMLAEGAETEDDWVTAERTDVAATCIHNLEAELKASGDKLAAMDAEFRAFEAAMDAKLDELIRLLNTPQGQRPGFPSGGNK